MNLNKGQKKIDNNNYKPKNMFFNIISTYFEFIETSNIYFNCLKRRETKNKEKARK